MARRKQQVLQETLTNQEEWDNFMSKGGLSVIDCHQSWCGPCKPVVGLFKRVKTELSSELLSFATADCDSIDSLELYRDNCEPCFQFYSGGLLAGIIRGCNAPLLENMIREKTELEERILRGEAERVAFTDSILEDSNADNTEESGEQIRLNDHHVAKLVTVALIKPDLTANDEKIEDILQKIEDNGLEIVADEEKLLSIEEVTDLYKHRSEAANFDELVAFMTSGPVRALGLTKGDTGEGVVELWRSIIGPFNPDDAKRESSDSIRARYGSNEISNAVHGSSSVDDAAKELGFFFPNFSPPRAVIPASVRAQMAADDSSADDVFPVSKVERTVTIIRPEALKAHKDQILSEITESGFQIVREKEITLTRKQTELLYEDQNEEDHYEALIEYMTSGPSLILCLAKDNAIEHWRSSLGPKVNAANEAPNSIRAKYAIGDFNPVHASTSSESVEKEEKILFAEETIALIKPDGIQNTDDIISHLESVGFAVQETRDVELSSEIASKIYAGKSGEKFFDDLVSHMTSGACKVLVLSDVDAVEKLKKTIGPSDPEEAKKHPDTIRGKIASSIIANGIHAPSDHVDAELHFQLLLE